MYCTSCGTRQSDNSQHCSVCGMQLITASPSSQPFQYAQQNIPPRTDAGNSNAIISLVCGIVGFFFLGIVLGTVAIITGNIAKKQGYTGIKATFGIVLGVIDIVLMILSTLLWIIAFSAIKR